MTSASRTGLAVLEDELVLSLDELSRSCRCSTQWLVALVHEGVLEPAGLTPASWRFSGVALQRARVAAHLMQDLDVNAPGVALALDLLDDVRALRHQVRFGPG
jgi:chaperone modulatory protein CbpM